MKQRPRIYYTESQKAIMCDRLQKGESLQPIAAQGRIGTGEFLYRKMNDSLVCLTLKRKFSDDFSSARFHRLPVSRSAVAGDHALGDQ